MAMISDQDKKFLSKLWQALFSLLKVTSYFSTAYHPQADGQSERTNQTVEIMIQHISQADPSVEWESSLPMIQYRLNGSKNSSTNETPHHLMYGMNLRRPWELMKQVFDRNFACCYDAEISQSLANVIMKHYYDRHHQPKYFAAGDRVYLRLYTGYNIPANFAKNKKLGQRYAGPFTVLEKVGRLAYHLELPSHWNIHNVINIAFLEPAPKDDDPFARTQPPPDAVHDERFPDDDDRYDIDKVLAKRTRRVGRTRRLFTEYLVRWKGFDESHDEWKRLEDLEGAKELVEEFENTS